MTVSLTREAAQIERRRILEDVHFHRTAARRRMRDLERLEADCARVGIRLIREPIRAQGGRDTDAGADPHSR